MLFATYIIVGIVPVLFSSTVIFKATENYYIEERKKELLNQANILSGHITISNYLYDENKKSEFDEDIQNTSSRGGFRTIVTDAMGTVVNDSNKTEIGKTYLLPEIIEALDEKDVANVQENGSIYAVASIVNEAGDKVGTVFLADMPNDILEKVDNIKRTVYLLMVAITLFIVM